MSSNNAWNEGRNLWTENSAWPSWGTRANENAYQEEGKRRKFDEMASIVEQTATGAPGEMSLVSRHRDSGPDSISEDKSHRSFAKKRLLPSEPSPHVIFLGLDTDFTEADLQSYLINNGCSLETVTIIRDRSTGLSKGFGFAQFTTTEHARAFVEPRFPFIQIPPPACHGASATAVFYKALETGIPHKGRRVKIDYSQSANPHEKGRMNRQNTNDGTRDIGNAQVRVLLFRGLDSSSSLQAIAQALHSSSGPGKDSAKGMTRIILIKDKMTMVSLGFAFVEFIDVQSASAVLAATMSPQIHPAGFRISDRIVAASFAHAYSFQLVPDPFFRDEACIPSSLGLGGSEGSWVRYWDESSTTTVLQFEVTPPPLPVAHPTKTKRDKPKHKEGDAEQVAPRARVEPSVLPKAETPLSINLNKSQVTNPTAKGIAPTPQGHLALFSSPHEFATISDEGIQSLQEGNGEKAGTGGKKIVVPLIASRKTVLNISKWNQMQDELNEGARNHSPVTESPQVDTKATPEPATPLMTRAFLEPDFAFSDTIAMTCLLCSRQFKNLEQLKRHNQESDLHKKNSVDPRLRDIAIQKAGLLKKAVTNNSTSEQPKYRDRASERRIMHNQPDVPLPPEQDISQKRRLVDGTTAIQTTLGLPQLPAPLPVHAGDDTNIGNRLLKKMGWKEGTGLGCGGEGIIEPLQTAIYSQGAGLGASKGRQVGQFAEGYSSYVHMAQESARERYDN